MPADRLARLATHLRAFEAPGFTFGGWVSPGADGGGAQLGWYEFSPEAESFLLTVRADEWVTPFDWRTWMETDAGRRLSRDPAAVADDSEEELEHLLTAIVRSDRFTEGSIAGAYESGLLTAILRRAEELSRKAG